VALPSYDPDGMARKAMADYDKNNDGKIDSDELASSPALKGALKQVDTDKDGSVSAEEIATRLRLFQSSAIGVRSIGGKVLRDGHGVGGVNVTLVPEPFMGDAIKPASGVSGPDGSVGFQTPGAPAPGVNPGFFRIEASKKDAAGTETLPARFNSNTTLGVEVSATMRGDIVIRLNP
jgi:hypothetical protein